ncbi:MAG: hypothetical protein L3J41_03660 [Melioribacteraceae bacterium]|nr:hypothetical protein [Melioribacteraceae bacterium]
MVLSSSKTIQVDSTNIVIPISALINVDRLDRMLTSSLQWGSIAIIIGATLETAFNPDDHFKYLMTALGGILASAGGLVYGTFSSIPTNYNVGENRFGLQINMGQTMAADSYRYIENFGFVIRYPNKLPLIPDNYVIYIGEEELHENSKENKHSNLNITKYGVQLRKVGYNRTLNFLYGIDFGQSKGSYSYSIEEGLSYFRSEWENVSSFYFDIIIGVNFNLTKNIHGSIEYQYELIGASTDDDVSSIFDNPARGVTSFSIYTFLW